MKYLESSRDKKEGAYRSGEGEKKRVCVGVTPDLSYA